MKIRAAGLSDLPAIMEIINEARRNLKEQGINQWQRSYPNAGVIERDIVAGNCYVAEEEGQVAASFAVSFDGDADYDKIYNGSWRREGRFAVVHRVAVGAAWRGRRFASCRKAVACPQHRLSENRHSPRQFADAPGARQK